MRLLLDTQVLLWQLAEPRRLGDRSRAAIASAEEAFISVLSFVEVGIKVAIGKLAEPVGLRDLVPDRRVLPLTADHGLALATLPLHHRDPFDRLLVVQAMAEGLAIVTADAAFADYGVPLIDARV